MKDESWDRHKFLDQLYQLGFKILEEEVHRTDLFGNFYIILQSRNILLRISQDRSIIIIEVQCDRNDWYDMHLLKALIEKDETDLLNKEFSFGPAWRFFIDNFNSIDNLFSEGNRSLTCKELNRIRDKRGAEMAEKLRRLKEN